MKKKGIIAIVWAVIVCLPCVLILNGGEGAPYGEESLGWTNVAGVAWLGFLVLGGFKMITPKWMRDELHGYMGDDE